MVADGIAFTASLGDESCRALLVLSMQRDSGVRSHRPPRVHRQLRGVDAHGRLSRPRTIALMLRRPRGAIALAATLRSSESGVVGATVRTASPKNSAAGGRRSMPPMRPRNSQASRPSRAATQTFIRPALRIGRVAVLTVGRVVDELDRSLVATWSGRTQSRLNTSRWPTEVTRNTSAASHQAGLSRPRSRSGVRTAALARGAQSGVRKRRRSRERGETGVF